MIWRALREPLLVFASLAALLACTTLYACLPGAPFKPVAALCFAGAKATLVVIFYMRLRQSDGLSRAALAAALAWLTLLFLLSFADLLTRP